jgi:Cu+-exporting ATPase
VCSPEEKALRSHPRRGYGEWMMQTLTVTGMTCDNCRRHVTEALSKLPGVHSVSVDLIHATASLESDREIGRSELAAVLEEEGYGLGS